MLAFHVAPYYLVCQLLTCLSSLCGREVLEALHISMINLEVIYWLWLIRLYFLGTDIILWHGKSGKILGNTDTNQLKNNMATISPNGRFIAAAAFTADVKVTWGILKEVVHFYIATMFFSKHCTIILVADDVVHPWSYI